MFDEKIVLQNWTTSSYWIACLNPDGSLIWWGSVWWGLYTQLIEYDINNNPIYLWEANPWELANTASDVWRIKKLVYDGNNNAISVSFADWDASFDNIWDNRASLSYS